MAPVTASLVSCAACIAAVTVPLALFLLLAETAAGGFVTVAYLHARGGLTQGFLKFITVTYALLAALALLAVVAGPPGSYRQVLNINQRAAAALSVLQALLMLALVGHTWNIWRGRGEPRVTWVLGVVMSALLLSGIAAALIPLAGSPAGGLAISAGIVLSALILGPATVGMLLGHWYLVTPTLTNLPLLRAIVLLLFALLAQAVTYPLILSGLTSASGSLTHALAVSPVLSVLWALGAVILPLLAAGLALLTCRIRSFMSTTGLLYLAMIAIYPGQLVGQLLFFVAAA